MPRPLEREKPLQRVSVKWGDTGDVEHFGKWSMTTSHHQTYFARVA